jgi:hypothetical protein
MARLATLLLGQLITLAAQLGYAYAFRESFERQARTLRERPWKCLGVGFGIVAFWTFLGLGALHLAALNQSAWILTLMTVPMFLASAAGGAVCLGVIAARALRWDLAQRPYASITIGQAVAAVLGLLPFIGVPAVALYACAGIGAVAVAEFSSADEEVAAPRLGLAGLACLLVLTAAITFGLVRGGRSLGAQNQFGPGSASAGVPPPPVPPPPPAPPQ